MSVNIEKLKINHITIVIFTCDDEKLLDKKVTEYISNKPFLEMANKGSRIVMTDLCGDIEKDCITFNKLIRHIKLNKLLKDD